MIQKLFGRLASARSFVFATASLVALASQAVSKSYINASGMSDTADCTEITSSTTTLNTGWYVVEGEVTISSTVTVSGDAKLILADGAKLTSTDEMDVLSQTDANAKSNFEASGMSLLVNAGTMRGENNVDDTNRLSIGKGAALKSGGDMSIRVDSTAKADARIADFEPQTIYKVSTTVVDDLVLE
jgi:hypothetical protein